MSYLVDCWYDDLLVILDNFLTLFVDSLTLFYFIFVFPNFIYFILALADRSEGKKVRGKDV